LPIVAFDTADILNVVHL